MSQQRRTSQGRRTIRLAEKADLHVVKLEPNGQNQYGADQAGEGRDSPFSTAYGGHGYWKEHMTRIQTTSRPEGRTSPTIAGLIEARLPALRQRMVQVTTGSGSPTSGYPTAELLSSRNSMATTSNCDRPIKLHMVSIPPNTANSMHLRKLNPMTQKQQYQKRNGQRQHTVQQQQILEEDSLYHDSQIMADRMRTTRGGDMPTTFNQSQITSQLDNETTDSIYRASECKQSMAFDNRFIQDLTNSRTGSIYSIKDQMHVSNIIRRKFPTLGRQSRQKTQDNINNQSISLDQSSIDMSTTASRQQRTRNHQLVLGQRVSQTNKQSALGGSLNIQQSGKRRQYQTTEVSCERQSQSMCHGSTSSKPRQTSQLKGSAQTGETRLKGTKKGVKGIFSRGVQNSIFADPDNLSELPHEKHFKSRFKSKGSPNKSPHRKVKEKDFMTTNKNNLGVTINRMHPQYQCWDSQKEHEKKDDYADDNNITNTNKAAPHKKSKSTAVQKKDNMVEAMQKRVEGQANLNAREILASAGISDHRNGKKNSSVAISMEYIPGAKDDANAVANIVRSMKIKREELTSPKKPGAKRNYMMIGKANQDNEYSVMPTQELLEDTYFANQSAQKRKFITQLAMGENVMEGSIVLKEYDSKLAHQKEAKQDPVKEYVKNFSQTIHQLKEHGNHHNESFRQFSSELTNQFKKHVDEGKTRKLKEIEQRKIEHTDRLGFGHELNAHQTNTIEAIIKQEIKKEVNVFNQCLEEESKLISQMGDKFTEKVKYIDRLSQRDVEHVGKGVLNKKDPKIHYFLQCKEDVDLALPILDKVVKKTLVLQEYSLSQGHCRGLARACQFFDHRFVNRVLFNNCGIDDEEFSHILEGLNKLKDFKSIIYKMNAFSELSLQNLRPLLLKRLPNHLEEIKLIDCQINGSHISKLIDLLMETGSQLRVLSLVNANQTENSFDKVIKYLKESEHLKELDLSWSKLPPTSWRKFLAVVSENRSLAALNLSHNKILEDQPKPTQEMLDEGTWELSDRNKETMLCFKDFIKYNIYLVSINLENTGLNVPAIMFISSLLTKAQGLRCLHLCANEGINPAIVDQIVKRIRGQDQIQPRVIHPYNKHKKDSTKISNKQAARFGRAMMKNQKQLLEVEEDNKWQQIREGLKLRSVINQKRINDLSTYLGEINMEGSFLSRKLIIQRHLATKHVMPGTAQWQIFSDKKDECWRCGQHILTLFLWTPRIGALTCEKDEEKTRYYKNEIEKYRSQDPDLAMNASRMPLIASTFNEWKYEKMKEAIPFCTDNDPNQPDFVAQCIEEEGMRSEATMQNLTRIERDLVSARKVTYYLENWQTVLMQMMSFKKPMVANAHQLTSQSLKVDPSHPVYIHLAWLKPGLHTYAISHEPDEVVSDGEEGKQDAFMNIFMKAKMVEGSKKRKTFYVHDMLATTREEGVPLAFNPRHARTVQRDKYRERPVFAAWQIDTAETVEKMMNHDKNRWNLRTICQTSQEYQRLCGIIIENYSLLTDIYHYLQTKSDRYPWVSYYTARKFFFSPTVLQQGFSMNSTIFDYCVKAANFQQDGKMSFTGCLNRGQFIEFIIRVVQEIFRPETDGADAHIDPKYSGFSLIRMTQLFFNTTLKQFVKSIKVSWQDFRDEQLWLPEVRLIFTMNEGHLRKMYSQYAAMGRGQGPKAFNCDYMNLADCLRLFCQDKQIGLTPHQIEYAFTMSKMTVVEETHQDALATYKKLLYVEFLEFIGRIAEQFFEESEMEELQLYQKIEYLLDEIFTVVSEKRIKQDTIIEEFSDSDDNY